MNYLGSSKVSISKIVKYEFWYYYIKPQYWEKVKLCHMDTGSFIVDIETEDILLECWNKDVETRFHSSNYEVGRLLRKAKNIR